jgi:hypothetical protein
VLLGLAFATAGLGLVAPGAAAVLAWVNGWTAAYIALCAGAIGSLPFAEIRTWRALSLLAAVLLGTTYAWRRWRTTSGLRI